MTRTGPFRALLYAAALMAFAASGPAHAQPPDPLPARLQTDANGVDLAQGTLHLSATDVTIGQPGAGGLSYARYYSGTGWRSAAQGSIMSSGSTYKVSLGRTSESFTKSGGVYTSNNGSGSTLTFDSGANTYAYTLANGTVAIFDKALAGIGAPASSNEGLLTSLVSPAGEAVAYHYNTAWFSLTLSSPPFSAFNTQASRLQSITNNFGYQLHIDYANNNPETDDDLADWLRPTKVTGFNRTVDYCAPMADSCSFSRTWPSASYTGTASQIATVTDTLSRVTTYTYSGGKLTAVKWPGAASNNIAVSYYASGAFTGFVSTVDRGYADWDYAYADASGVRTTTVTDADSKTRTVTSTISTGLVATNKDALNRTTSYEYDSDDRLSKVTAPEGNYVEYDYDARGNLTETRRVAKSGSGLADIVTSATYPSTCANPVTCNKPTTTTDARGEVTDYTYDSTHGGLLTQTAPDPDGAGALVRPEVRRAYAQKQAYFKDSASTWTTGAATYVLVETSSCATAASCDGGADETVITLAYPSSSTPNNLQPLSITAAAGNAAVSSTTTFAYDDLGDVETVDGPLSGAADTARFRYDAARQLVGVIGPDPDGGGALKHRASRTSYNAYGQPTISERGTVNSQSDADWAAFSALEKTETVYDVHGRPIEARVFDGSTKLAVSQQSYDVVGRAECAALRMNPATFGSLPSSACTHASAGVFGADRISKTVYNAAGQATKTISGFGTGLAQDTITTSYTTNGLVATLTDARGGKTSYDYDGHDRLKKTRFPDPSTANASSTTDYEELSYGTSGASLGLVTARRLRDGTSIAYAHDDLGRLISSDAPGSTPDVTYAYDSFGRVTSLSQSGHALTYAYDQLSRLVSETQPLGTVSYEYDAAGRRTKLAYPGSYYLDYDWSVAGDLLKIRENGASSGVGVLATYAYDALGRRASLTRGNGNVTTYGFDAASRLNALDLDLDGATTTNDLAFDFAHNPASQIVGEDNANDVYDWTEPSAFTDAYTVNYLNQYLTAAGATIAHDARGNISSDGTTSFTYDAMNRLTSVSGGASASLAYDPASRLYEVAGGATTRFLYDGADIIAEYDGSNALLRRYVHGPGADEALVWLEGTDTSDRRFLIADTRGSIVAIADATGATTNKNLYDAYGTPHAANAGRFQYTGQIWLAEAGLYHYKARAYSPMLGRFLQTDPIGYGDGMNMYAYVGNDPVNFTDPTGKCPWCAVGAVASGFVQAITEIASGNLDLSNGVQMSDVQAAGRIAVATISGAVGGGAASFFAKKIVGGGAKAIAARAAANVAAGAANGAARTSASSFVSGKGFGGIREIALSAATNGALAGLGSGVGDVVEAGFSYFGQNLGFELDTLGAIAGNGISTAINNAAGLFNYFFSPDDPGPDSDRLCDDGVTLLLDGCGN